MYTHPLAKKVGTGTGANLTGMTPINGGLETAKRLALVVKVNAVGATPALSVKLEATFDGGTTWEAVALTKADSTVAAANTGQTVTPTAGATTVFFVDGLDKRFVQGLRINATANTNVTDWDAELRGIAS